MDLSFLLLRFYKSPYSFLRVLRAGFFSQSCLDFIANILALNVDRAFEFITKSVISKATPEDIQYDNVNLELGQEPKKEDGCC